MSSFEKGCMVALGPTARAWKVILWDREDELLLLAPCPPSEEKEGVDSGERGTRWAFQKDATLMGGPKAPKTSTAAASGGKTPGSAADVAVDPTPFARRAAKLDRRLVFRNDPAHPKRGRGLFAVRSVSINTEVMRVRAAGVVVPRRSKIPTCCRCFSTKRGTDGRDCHGCRSWFCSTCVDAVAKSSGVAKGSGGGSSGAGDIHKATCDFSQGLLRLCGNDPEVDEAILRLSGDILARRKAGLINDEEWTLLNTLESSGSSDGTIGLSVGKLKECVRLFKETMDMDVSREDVQTMYRRVVRNLHTVADELTTGPSQITALFPYAALINHACKANAFFHSEVVSSSADGPVLEYVLRTTAHVKVGDEVLVSYLSSASMCDVTERQNALKVWDFRCACSRCAAEIKERKRLDTHPRPDDPKAANALNYMLGALSRQFMPQQGSDSDKHHEVLQSAVDLASSGAGELVSPVLQQRLALNTPTFMTHVDPHGELKMLRLMAFAQAAEELTKILDHKSIYMHRLVFREAVELLRDPETPKFLIDMAQKALFNAIKASRVFFGPRHALTLLLKEKLESFQKQVARAVVTPIGKKGQA